MEQAVAAPAIYAALPDPLLTGLLALGGVGLYLAALHLWIGLRGVRPRAFLSFAALCLAAAYAGVQTGLVEPNRGGSLYWLAFGLLALILLISRGLAKAVIQGAAARHSLRLLSAEMALTEERERRRLAQALHDSPVQTLAIALLQIDANPREETLAKVTPLIRQSLAELRAVVFQLSPPVLYTLGLDAALSWLAEEVERRWGLRCRFEPGGPATDLPEPLSVVLFQCVRELALNAVKHAAARDLIITRQTCGRTVRITVQDDGQGFAVRQIPGGREQNRHFGLFSLQQRLIPLGGRLDIESGVCGTRATLTALVSETNAHHDTYR